MATATETVTFTQTPPASPKPTPPSPKPTPTRKGTLNFGLRRKSSNASLTPSTGSGKGRESIDGEAPATNGDDSEANGRSSSEIRRPMKPKRMFSLLAPRTSKSTMASADGANGHSQDASEQSETENGTATHEGAKSSSSLASSLFSSARRGSGGKFVEALTQEKKALEEQVETLKTERTAIESAFDAEKEENRRLTSEAAKLREEWEGEKLKFQEEVSAKDTEVKSLSTTVTELKEDLEKTKESEAQLLAFKEASIADFDSKIADGEKRAREAVAEEQETLKVKLAEAELAGEAKDQTIKGLEAQLAELTEKAKVVEEELKKLKEEKEKMQADAGKRASGSCSIM